VSGDLERARELIAAASKIVAFTGAGISKESGISTYRGEDGMWSEYDPEKYANIDYFREDPSLFWNFFNDVRYPGLVYSEPNPAHLALAELERQGKLDLVVTQNIDGLHTAAGNTKVVELHGNTRIIGCLECEKDYDFETIRRQVQTEIPPYCRACGGLLKPRVTFFGEALPAGAMERAAAAANVCDLLLVVGSSLLVYPAASIPLMAKRVGAKLIIVNVGETAQDELADVKIDGRAGEVLPQLIGG
jgi:NAD-dependent deacetylase